VSIKYYTLIIKGPVEISSNTLPITPNYLANPAFPYTQPGQHKALDINQIPRGSSTQRSSLQPQDDGIKQFIY